MATYRLAQTINPVFGELFALCERVIADIGAIKSDRGNKFKTVRKTHESSPHRVTNHTATVTGAFSE